MSSSPSQVWIVGHCRWMSTRRPARCLPQLIACHATEMVAYRKMVKNLAWAVGYNVVAIPLAAGALAWAGFVLPPAAGALAMSISTIVVAVNAMLLRGLDLRP